jgi:hypothetical protein
MNRFMFGLDCADPAGSARRLAEAGYDGVVISASAAPGIFAAAREAGLEIWMCYGAHSTGEFFGADHGAIDAKGRPAPWFGSSCPNDTEINAFNMNSALNAAGNIPGLKGIFVDGARFASFASAEGIGSFFGCFCPRCMAKMREMGYDPEALKSGIAQLMDYIDGGDGDIPFLRDSIENWFNFRADCVKKYMDAFAIKAHAANLKAGAFVFAPSLWWFVGQRPECCSALDAASPMLYRAYPHRDGTACLSHEWACFKEMLSHGSRPASELASILFDMPLMSDDPMAGFAPEHIEFEVTAARAMLNRNIRLMPIIQTEDPELEKVYDAVMNSGADGCGEFMYSQKAAFGSI